MRKAVIAAELEEAALAQVEAQRTQVRAEAGRDPAAALARREKVQLVKSARKERASSSEPAKPIPSVRQRGRRWRISLSNGEQNSEVDSFWARIGRCQKRIGAWKDTIPRLNRRLRRIYKGKGIGPRLVMITLTYADANTKHKLSDGWEPNHIREFMQKLRKELKNKLWAYAWVAEMQERKSVHYHIMVYVAPGTYIPTPDKPMEDGTKLWPHGDSGCETAETGARYLMTYVGKEYQKEGLPAGARMFAVWIGKKTATAEELFGFRLSSAPPYVQEAVKAYYAHGIVQAEVRWKRKTGGGWEILYQGETVDIVQSEWYLTGMREILPEEVEGGDYVRG